MKGFCESKGKVDRFNNCPKSACWRWGLDGGIQHQAGVAGSEGTLQGRNARSSSFGRMDGAWAMDRRGRAARWRGKMRAWGGEEVAEGGSMATAIPTLCPLAWPWRRKRPTMTGTLAPTSGGSGVGRVVEKAAAVTTG
uniref:Uncharacterized protein n=1 Tax=Oryza meridionalis TaxID=40149 RepID=A0A0E0FDH9_9ORYZ